MGEKKRGEQPPEGEEYYSPFSWPCVEHVPDFPSPAERQPILERRCAVDLLEFILQRSSCTDTRASDSMFLAHCVSMAHALYKREKFDALEALRVFSLFTSYGIYPPVFILEWLARSFDDYLDREGEENLEVSLGLKREGKHSPFSKLKEKNKDENVLFYRSFLVDFVGLKPGEANEICAQMLGKSDPLANRTISNKAGKNKEYRDALEGFWAEVEAIDLTQTVKSAARHYQFLREFDAEKKMEAAFRRKGLWPSIKKEIT